MGAQRQKQTPFTLMTVAGGHGQKRAGEGAEKRAQIEQ
jgi:hypothetical protein